MMPASPQGWPRQFSSWLQHELAIITAKFSAVAARTVDVATLRLAISSTPLLAEVVADGTVYLRADLPELFKIIGTTFNTGGETGLQFRVPNIPSPLANTQWRITVKASRA
jgi:hypothetical protein